MVDISDDHYELDISRARSLLGWEPKHSLRDTLPRMVEALKADPFGWYRANKLNAARMAGARVEAEQQKQAEEDPLWHHEMLRKHMASMGRKIGRASCRERVCQSV